MGARIPNDEREAIAADIRAGLPRNEVARKHGRSEGSISNIAREYGLTFDRAQVENATRARTTDMAARRAQLAEDLLDDVAKFRKRAWSEYQFYERGPFGPEKLTLELPPLAEARNAYTAIGIAVDKHLVLVKHDTGSGADEARSMLGALAEGLGAAYRAMQAEDDGAST